MSERTKHRLHDWRDAVPNDRTAHLVRDLSRAFSKLLQLRLAEHGVPLGHWTFLRILWAQDGLTQRELSSRAGVMEPTTVVAMKAMEALGYIERERLPENQKNIYIRLTEKGRALQRRLVPVAERINEIGTATVSREHLATTRATLLTMIDNLAAEIDSAEPKG